MTLVEAVAEGLRPSPHGDGFEGGVLSAREAEVLRLAAEGLADAQIAAALHLSPRTVGNHLSAVYRKLGVTNRTAAVRHVHYGDGSPGTSEGSVTPVT
jgi:DNA-binding NarL/FixJ family response regulator